MKKTSHGKIYNLKCNMLADWNNRRNYNDFHFEEQTLYVTKYCTFLVNGFGGGGTDWGKDVGNVRCGGQHITPTSQGVALKWYEQNGAKKVIAKHFSDIVSEAWLWGSLHCRI